VALLVDEFFGAWNTAIGGYGALARKYFAKYVPNEEIQVDVLLDTEGGDAIQRETIDGIDLYRLAGSEEIRQRWLERQLYNVFVSIEMTYPSFEIVSKYRSDTQLLYWVQDPRPLDMYQSRLQTVSRLRDDDWSYMKSVIVWMKERMARGLVTFASQGESLSQIARAMFEIPVSTSIDELVNPIEIERDYQLGQPAKENKVVFLGRLEAQKRVWIVCELARKMPQYEFYVIGATGIGRNETGNTRSLESYRNQDGSSKIANLHFTGHLDGEAKAYHLKTAKVLINTSIWEGIPVSWLEAMSYGTVIVSSFERDELIGRFGTFVGEIMGDGTTPPDLSLYAAAIDYWMTHEAERIATAEKAINFIRDKHTVECFKQRMREAILATIP
jgi:glycosyltransferase involved in cell wall biosynthesis